MKMNPVYRQETTAGSRSFKLPLVILIFNSILALVALLDMYSMINQVRQTAEIQYSSFLSLYVFAASVEFVMLLFLVPAMTAGSISGERERRTLNLLLTTKMTAGDVVIGKLAANLSTILLLIVSSFPILALVFIYGGITILDAARLLLCYVTTAFLTGSIGVFCSAYFRKSTIATVASYCITVLLSLGTVAAYELSGVLGHGSGFSGSSGLFYLMLFNPGATFRSVLSSQIGAGNEIADFFPWLEQGPVSFVSEHWMLFGTVTQIGLAVILVWLAVRKVEPVKRRSAKKIKH